jgi:hypothetical protein
VNSRPLLDYLAGFDDDFAEPAPMAAAPQPAERGHDPLEARLKDLEARLRANDVAAHATKPDLTLSAQIEKILKRQAASQLSAHRPAAAPVTPAEPPPRPAARVVVDPPPTAPASHDVAVVDQEFLKFTEAVYLMGQAAKRFIEQPQPAPPQPVQPQPLPVQPVAAVQAAPSTVEIEALSAVLRETVAAFRSVADDLAVSAGEIRNHATREERQPPQRYPSRSARHRDDDEIFELREHIADLQDRLDDLLHARRRRY